MPLARQFFSLLLIICALFLSAAHAEERLALKADSEDSLILPSDGNIEQEISSGNELASSSLWERLRNGFAMQEMSSPLVATNEQWYATRPEYMERMVERARRYLYFITTEVERRGMPSEIALLPMIESAFVPNAYSTGRASGIWQFIPSTGRNFGMQQNWWYDGRRNIISATNGALDYLQKLYGMFGDWELALAAYNWGEGAVQHAQERNRRRGLPVNYASLKMPSETRNYVPKLMAIRNIIANPSRFGLTLEDIPDEPYFSQVSTSRHIDARLVAELADITMDEFIALNPAHNRPVILQDNSDLILLPVGSIEIFRTNLESYDRPLVSWQAYQPRKGERFGKIAQRFGISEETLKSVNGLPGRTAVSSGQTLLVPGGEEDKAEGEFSAFNMNLVAERSVKDRSVKYTVRKGDTFGRLARRFHVSIASLKRSNKSLKSIRVGQVITIEPGAYRKHSGRSGGSHKSA